MPHVTSLELVGLATLNLLAAPALCVPAPAPQASEGPLQGVGWHIPRCPINWPSGSGRFAPPPGWKVSDPIWHHLGHKEEYTLWRRGMELPETEDDIEGVADATKVDVECTEGEVEYTQADLESTGDSQFDLADAVDFDYDSTNETNIDVEKFAYVTADRYERLREPPSNASASSVLDSAGLRANSTPPAPEPKGDWGSEVGDTATKNRCCRPTWDCVMHEYWVQQCYKDGFWDLRSDKRDIAFAKRDCCIAQYHSTCSRPQDGDQTINGKLRKHQYWWNWPPHCSNPDGPKDEDYVRGYLPNAQQKCHEAGSLLGLNGGCRNREGLTGYPGFGPR